MRGCELSLVLISVADATGMPKGWHRAFFLVGVSSGVRAFFLVGVASRIFVWK